MENYKKLFSHLDSPEPPAGLAQRILANIQKRERRILGMKIALSSTVFGVSLFVIVAGCINLMAQLSNSGFFQFSSLLISDFSTTIANFPDFALSLAEAFPALSAAVVLGGILFAIWSLSALLDETALMNRRTT